MRKVLQHIGADICEEKIERSAQYSRRECAEIIGIPNSIVHNDFEKTVRKVLQHIGADICEEKIESHHRINKKSNRTIVKFSRRKDCEQVMRVKKDLKDLDPTDLDFPAGTRLFINDGLCPITGDFGTNVKNYGSIKKYFGLLPLMVQFG